MPVKSNTLLIVSRRPGRCGQCRHANQGTVDFREGRVFCQMGGDRRFAESECDQQTPAMPVYQGDLVPGYFMYEPFTGANGTWCNIQDRRLLAEDADERMRQYMRIEQPFIPADGRPYRGDFLA